MSWSRSPLNAVTSPDELDLIDTQDLDAEATEQVSAAVAAAKGLISSGALGSGYTYSVSLYGHANAGHAPADGWANDSVTITVTQSAPVPPTGEATGVTIDGATTEAVAPVVAEASTEEATETPAVETAEGDLPPAGELPPA